MAGWRSEMRGRAAQLSKCPRATRHLGSYFKVLISTCGRNLSVKLGRLAFTPTLSMHEGSCWMPFEQLAGQSFPKNRCRYFPDISRILTCFVFSTVQCLIRRKGQITRFILKCNDASLYNMLIIKGLSCMC